IAKYDAFAQSASEQSSKQEITAMQTERSCEDCYKAEYMRSFIGDEFTALVSGVTSYGMYVELPNTVEGLVRNDSISKNALVLNEGVSITDTASNESYRIGDEVKVILTGTDVAQGNVDFALVR
ncbi:MAG: S1 RNA-binding domain-containing protein, partial [Oscillospiraceae bacterium]